VSELSFARAPEGAQLVPWKRFGTAEEVAPVIAFLASKEASYVRGAQYTMGGGMEARIGGCAGRRPNVGRKGTNDEGHPKEGE
jgi:NAD(P)-dependent dehydrogenase (short-subunit alcohol dehydrogenase family)